MKSCYCSILPFLLLGLVVCVGATVNLSHEEPPHPLENVQIGAVTVPLVKPFHIKLEWDGTGPFALYCTSTNAGTTNRIYFTSTNSQTVSNLYSTNKYTFRIANTNNETGSNGFVYWRPANTNVTIVTVQSNKTISGLWETVKITNDIVLTDYSGPNLYFRVFITNTNNLSWIQSFERLD